MIDTKVIEKHLEELQYKYVACETNINNLQYMINSIESEIKAANKEQLKTFEIQKEQLQEELKTNEKAMKMHEANILFLNNKLWIS